MASLVVPYWAASNASLDRFQSQGLLFGSKATFSGLNLALGMDSCRMGRVWHLGICVGRDAAACSYAMFQSIIAGLRMKVGN